MEKVDVIIAGGGIAGLAAAMAVGQHETLVLEQASTWSNSGAGLQLGPNAVRALRALGVWEAVAPFTSSPPEIHIHDGLSGKRLARWKLGKSFEQRFGAPYRVAHRADLHRALLACVTAKTNITMRNDEAVREITPRHNGVDTITTKNSYAAKHLLAADGVKSLIRQNLFKNSPPCRSGKTNHRALIPQPSVTHVALDCVNLWLHPHGHVVHYPVGADQNLNIVAITPDDGTPQTFFAQACDTLQTILAHVAYWTPWPSLYVEPLPHTHADNVLLIGDAAHGTVPYLAQGAAMALEDAAALVAHALNFEKVSASRAARTRRVHNASLQQGKIFHASGLQKQVYQATMTLLPAPLALSRLAWLYKGE